MKVLGLPPARPLWAARAPTAATPSSKKGLKVGAPTSKRAPKSCTAAV